jgi:hypothetical protein
MMPQQPVRRPDHRAVDDALDAGLGQHRNALTGTQNVFLDAFEVFVQQFVAEVHRRTVLGPVTSVLFIGAHEQPLPFLAQVVLAVAVGDQRQAIIERLDLGNCLGHEILVLERHQRQFYPCHCGHFTCPQAGRIDHDIGMNRTLVGLYVPAAVGSLAGGDHRGESMHLGAALTRTLSVSMGNARRIDVTAVGFVHDAADAVEIGERMHALGLVTRQFVELDLEVLRLGGLHAQLVLAVRGLREVKRTRLKDTAALPGLLFQVFVEPHGVVL